MDAKSFTCVPFVVLQGVKPLLSLTDVRLARLVCKDWAGELAASVNAVQLPPELWQTQNSRQTEELRRLVKTYWSFRHAILLAASQQEEVGTESLHQALDMLQGIAALRSVTIRCLHSSCSSWNMLISSLAGLQQITSLEVKDVQLPGPEGLASLTGLSNIQNLSLHSSSSNKLQQEHLAAIARMAQLKRVKLVFRTVNGCLAEPLTLDCLGALRKLTHLEVNYTGMSELSTGVCFASEELLPGCTSLSSLVLCRVPTPSLRGIFKLQQLRQLTLLQVSPMAENQARSLALCTQLQHLTLDNMPLELLPQLAPLTALESIHISVWNPLATGGQDLPGGQNILALGSLTNLKTLGLSGPVMVCREDIQALAAAWIHLEALNLAVTLLDGTQGFAGFKRLEVLRLSPLKVCGGASRRAGDAGLGGFEEGPLLNGQKGLVVYEGELPQGLRELEGHELIFSAEGLIQQQQQQQLGATAGEHNSLKSLTLQYSPDTPNHQPPQLPGPLMLQGVSRLKIQHPLMTGQQLAAALTACGSSLTHLAINTADILSQFSKPVMTDSCTNAAATSSIAGAGGSSFGASSSGGRASSCSARPGSSSSSSSSFTSSGSSSTKSAFINGLYSTAAAAGAAAVAAAAAAAAPMAAAAGMPVSGMAVATVAATAGVATAGATAGALSRANSLSSPRSSSITRASSSVGMLENFRQSSVGLSLQSMGSFTLQTMGSASLANLISDTLIGIGGGSGSSGNLGPGSMGSGLNEGPGLALLGQCTELEDLNLVVGDRLLSAKTRAAIAALPQLRKLTLAVASDSPAAAARELGAWVAGMKSLEWVAVGLEGPGSADALSGMVARISAGLPACQVNTLRPSTV